MIAQRKETILYKNNTWRVTEQNVETLDGFYWIPVNKLGDIREGTSLPEWPIHLCEKNWVNSEEFMDAFRFALKVHRGKYRGSFSERLLDLAEIELIRDSYKKKAEDLALKRWKRRQGDRKSITKFIDFLDCSGFFKMWNKNNGR